MRAFLFAAGSSDNGTHNTVEQVIHLVKVGVVIAVGFV
jgi:hypothetical protein